MVVAIEPVVMLELEFSIVNVHMWTIADSHSSAPVVWTCTDWSDHRLAFRLHSPASLKEMYARPYHHTIAANGANAQQSSLTG